MRKKERWLARRYGSQRGFIRTIWHKSLFVLGRYRKYQEVDWTRVERVVFVCKGNICRSAYAEAVARNLGLEVISCGLDTIENAPASSDAVYVAEKLGVDLTQHFTQPVMYLSFKKTDLLIAMEPWQVLYLEKNLFRKHQCTLLGLWAKPILPHIQDPYGASQDYFERCFSYIKDSVYEIDKKIKKKS